MAKLWLGTSGWSYKDWRGPFYPPGLPAREWFAFYARHFATVELNVTFYRIPGAPAVQHWRELAPPGFIFAAKLYREITHWQRLQGSAAVLERYDAALALLGERLGVVLIQLPPSLAYEAGVAEVFLKLLRERDPRRRYAIECRHASWFTPEVYALLERYAVALCIADWGQPFPPWEVVTAPFHYVRFHGPTAHYASKYPDQTLARAAGSIRGWLERGLDVYVYFNNDWHGYAIENARRLRELLGEPEPAPTDPFFTL